MRTVLTEDDIRALKRGTSRPARIAASVGLPCASLLALVLGVANLIKASSLAEAGGRTMGEVLGLLMSGPEPGAEYAGYAVMAVDRIQIGAMSLALAAVLAVLVPFLLRSIGRSERCLAMASAGREAQAADAGESEELKERLKSLGYLG